jgi:hypothetical protein
MGHLRLWRLPRTHKWQQVVSLILDTDSTVEDIAAGSIAASTRGLGIAAEDPALTQAFLLLARIPLAARSGPFPDNLRALGLPVSDEPTVIEVATALGEAIDQHRGGKKWQSDIGEMARLAATESVTALASATTGTLFTTTANETRMAFKPLSTERNFGFLARDFFARFVGRFLEYHLSRELPNHVGKGRRFRNSQEHTEFNQALDLHCRQAARIVQDFAGGWLGKTEYETGITTEKAKGFVHVALKKLSDELAVGAAEK